MNLSDYISYKSQFVLYTLFIVCICSCKSSDDQNARQVARDIIHIQRASLLYYNDNNTWPTTLNTLLNTGYLNHNWQPLNPWGIPYALQFGKRFLIISSTVPAENHFHHIKRYINGAQLKENNQFWVPVNVPQAPQAPIKEAAKKTLDIKSNIRHLITPPP